ncbi:CoA transferase [Mycolicibacterium goodii]|uniref:CaiB/BaiF CoA transferase family protein n=1 Tax=Mycolicibacterium goodii TaxID=134601 RepID=UPI001BDCFE7F|nr:CoA transferase [Mycolicibacterium goodii]MBU8808173.1 CoA transferase [Mycolicibacterium goodii]
MGELGQQSQPNHTGAGPLRGIRVLDLTHVLAGPLTTMLLGDLGAEVIKVERPGVGDETRGIPPRQAGESHYYLSVNRNKKSIAVDLKTKKGRDLVLQLIDSSDVVVENFRPGVAAKLGLDADTVKRRNPAIVYCSISAFGQRGPWSTRSAFDIAVQAMSGAMTVSGEPDSPPVRAAIPLADLAAGLFAAIGVLAALVEVRSTRAGKTIDIAMLDSTVGLLGYLASYYLMTGESPQRVGGGHVSIVPYGVYKAADGYLVIATLTESFWPKLCGALGRADLAADPELATNAQRLRRRADVDREITSTLRTQTVAEWCQRLTANDVPHAPVLTIAQALEHEQVADRGLIRTVEHPTLGSTRIMGPTIRFDDGPPLPASPAPVLAADTATVLASVLGLSDREITELITQGVIEIAMPADEFSHSQGDTGISGDRANRNDNRMSVMQGMEKK